MRSCCSASVTEKSKRHNAPVDAAQLRELAGELGLDAVGAAAAKPYANVERTIAARKARGLLADLRFTIVRPEVSCHPELLVPGARSVVAAALAYYAPGPEPQDGEGRLSRHAWRDIYAELRAKLEALAGAIGGTARVLVDSSNHVDAEAAARAGVGFYGKNTLVIVPRLGSWVALGAVITDAEIEPAPALERGCGSCRLCLEACPTGALVEPGVLDAGRCLSYWTQAAAPTPEPFRRAMADRVYGCDACQEVCPWNRGPEKRAAAVAPESGEPAVSLADWLSADASDLLERYRRLYVPRRDVRWLRRNALVACAAAGTAEHVPPLERFAAGSDALLADHAAWALRQLRGR